MKNTLKIILISLFLISQLANAQTNGIVVAGGNGSGSAANQLDTPISTFIDSNGNTYVADFLNHRVQKWAPNAIEGITVAGGNGDGNASNQLSYPTAIYVDVQGNIYVADGGNNRIQKWELNATEGITVAGGNGAGNSANQLNFPRDITFDTSGDLIIADMMNYRVQKWVLGATEGITIAGGNGYGSALNQFGSITSVFMTPDNILYVAQEMSGSIRRWLPNATEGESLGTLLDFLYPRGMVVENDGSIIVATTSNNSIIKVNSQHTQFEVLIGGGTGQFNSLNVPTDIAINNLGQIYVADMLSHRIIKFTPPFGCQPPLNIATNSATTNSFNVEWNSESGFSYKIRFKKETSTEWTETSALSSTQNGTMQYTIEYLESGEKYEFQIQTTCPNGSNSQYSESQFVTTIPSTPSISVLENQPNCRGALNHLGASNCNGTIVWSDGATGSSIVVSPISTTIYSAICTKNNVSSSVSNTITVDILEERSISISNFAGSCIQNFINLSIPLDTIYFKINWFKNGQNIDSNNLSQIKSMYVRQVSTENDLATYYTKIERKIGGCTVNSDTLNFAFQPLELPIVRDTTIQRGTLFNANVTGCSGTVRWFKFPVRVPGRSNDFVIDGSSINAGYVFSDTTLYLSCFSNCESGRVNYNIKVTDPLIPPNPPVLTVTYQNECTMGSTATIIASGCNGSVTFYQRNVIYNNNSLESISPSTITPYSLIIGYSNTIYASCEENGVKSPLSSVVIKQRYPTESNINLTPTELNSTSTLVVNMNSDLKIEVISSSCADEIKWYDVSNQMLLGTGNLLQLTNLTSNKNYYATCLNQVYGCPTYKYFTINIDQNQPKIYPTKSRFSICGTGNTNLQAWGCDNNSISWFDSEASTIPIGTGNTFLTPNFTNNTSSNQFYNYWVGCTLNGQEVRSIVNLVVAPTPNNVIARDSVLGCNLGSINIPISGCNPNYEFYQSSSGGIINNSLFHSDPLFTNASRVYRLNCKNRDAQCISNSIKEITISYECTPPSPPSINVINVENNNLTSNASNQNSVLNVCFGSEVILSAAGCPNNRVLWKDGDLFTRKSIVINQDTTKLYAYCIDPNNVISSKSSILQIKANPKPIILINNPLRMTLENTFDLTNPNITAGSNFPVGSVISYFKDFDLNIPLTNPSNLLSAGTYYLKVTSQFGCIASSPVSILPNCNSVFNLISPNDDVSFGEFLRKSNSSIDMRNKITGTAKVQSFSSVSITLSPGFVINPVNGGFFKAGIDGCSN
ncbi:MAG: fibronectin type III domain-containing protein [Spirosomataceae bacterium]